MIKNFLLIVNAQTLFVMISACLSTFLCIKFEIKSDFPLTLVGTAIIFPIVFTISGAFKRRENALAYYASLKAHGKGLYFASRDWVPNSNEEIKEEVRENLYKLFSSLRKLFTSPLTEIHNNEMEVYSCFSELSETVKKFRSLDLPSGEASRCNQFLNKALNAFENIKHIYQYRTPKTLRTYSAFFLHVLPVLYGPYFANLASESHPYVAFFMPVLFSLIFVSLENIQEHLENPFDLIGADDVIINAEKFRDRLD